MNRRMSPLLFFKLRWLYAPLLAARCIPGSFVPVYIACRAGIERIIARLCVVAPIVFRNPRLQLNALACRHGACCAGKANFNVVVCSRYGRRQLDEGSMDVGTANGRPVAPEALAFLAVYRVIITERHIGQIK